MEMATGLGKTTGEVETSSEEMTNSVRTFLQVSGKGKASKASSEGLTSQASSEGMTPEDSSIGKILQISLENIISHPFFGPIIKYSVSCVAQNQDLENSEEATDEIFRFIKKNPEFIQWVENTVKKRL